MIRRFLALALLAIPVVAQAQVLITPEPYISSSGVVSGQLSIPAGTASDPSIVLTDDDDGTGTGIYRISANILGFTSNGIGRFQVDTAGASVLSGTIRTLAGSVSVPAWRFNITDTNTGAYLIGDANLGFSLNGALVFDLEDTNAAGASANLATVSSTLGIMDGSDTLNGLSVELANDDHTGVGNTLAAFTVAAITGDAQARETAVELLGGFDVGVSSVAPIFDRQDFDEPIREVEEDYTAKVLTDGGVNLAIGHGGILFEYREEQDKTASSIIFTSTGGLDISADNGASDNEGVEIYLGASQNTTTGYLVAQTDQLCFSVDVNVALIAGTDQFVIGWRGNAAYVADNLYTGYAEYAVIGINNIDGSVFALSETATGPDTGSDDSETNWANAETKTLKVCIDGAGLTHHYLDGTIIAEDDGSNPNDFAMTSGTIMNPFISYLGVNGTDAAIVVNHWALTAN